MTSSLVPDYDYQQLGFRAGLEIHAQLKSARKLFCHCKPELVLPDVAKNPDYTFERYFRPVLGEMGDYDPGMLIEFEKHYQVIYHTFGDNVCTYELDETPPFYPDLETIKTGFYLADYFNCQSLVDEIVFNRKQYLDGSITTGFQRTAIIGRDGWISVNGRKIRISNLHIEEDAARRVEWTDRRSRTVFFNLDRLSIPLTEIITNHEDCQHPDDLYAAAMLIGLGLRACGKGKRGIGTIRQDVNISIAGGNRVELKGIQNLQMLKIYVDREIQRQLALIDIKKELEKRQVKPNDFEHIYVDLSTQLEDKFPALGTQIIAMGVRLPNCADILVKIVQPGRMFGDEVVDKCELITGVGKERIFYSGGIPIWIENKKIEELRKVLACNPKDGFLFAVGSQNEVIHVLKKAIERIKIAVINGVPLETRRVLPNGNNEFLRVIHGKDRLYPDTDTPPIPINEEVILEIQNQPKPIQPWKLMEEFGLSLQEIGFIIREEEFPSFFIELVKTIKVHPRQALGLLQHITTLKKEGLGVSSSALKEVQDHALKLITLDSEFQLFLLREIIETGKFDVTIKQQIEHYFADLSNQKAKALDILRKEPLFSSKDLENKIVQKQLIKKIIGHLRTESKHFPAKEIVMSLQKEINMKLRNLQEG